MTPDLPPVLPGLSDPILGPLRVIAYGYEENDVYRYYPDEGWVCGFTGADDAWYSLRLGSPIARANGIGGESSGNPGEVESPKPDDQKPTPPKPEGETPIIIMTSGGVSEYRSHPDLTPEYHGGFMSPERVQKLESDLAAARAEIDRLAGCLKKANGNFADYERLWYLRGDEIESLRAALEAGRLAIGEHFAPNDCYSTGPLTGDPIRDLVCCPACAFIAQYNALAPASSGKGEG